MKGRLFSMKITPTGVMRLYGARVYAKVMDPSARSGWQWFDLPVTPPRLLQLLYTSRPTDPRRLFALRSTRARNPRCTD